MRLAYLAAFVSVLLVAGASFAQVMTPRIMRPPPVATQLPAPVEAAVQAPNSDLIAQDPATLKATIERLKKDKRVLRTQLQTSVADLQEARRQLDEMTRPGGSLVTAQCPSPYLSRNTAGAEENCAASGYGCDAVSGLCKRMCTTSNDCSAGFVCDTGAARCVVPTSGE